jgi:hypothetical protein
VAINSTRVLKHLTKTPTKEFNVGVMKHRFMVPGNEHDLDTIIHNLFPVQGLVALGQLRNIRGAEQDNSARVSSGGVIL